MLLDAELVLILDNQLGEILSLTGPWDVEQDLLHVVEACGYYFEFGNAWNLGFYPLEVRDGAKPLVAVSKPYAALLADPRWKTTRNRILLRDAHYCQDCGARGRLEVHHAYYRYPRLPWQYPDAAFITLCPACHEQRTEAEHRFRTFLPRLSWQEIRYLDKKLREVIDECGREKPFDLTKAMGENGDSIEVVVDAFRNSRKQARSRFEPYGIAQ